MKKNPPADRPACNITVDYSSVPGSRILPFEFSLNLMDSVLEPAPGQRQRFCYHVRAMGSDEFCYANLSYFIIGLCEEIDEDLLGSITVIRNNMPETVILGENVTLIRPDTVTAGATTTVVGTYVAGTNVVTPAPTGLLRLQTVPPVPARVFLNGIARDTWGLNWVKLPFGSYSLTFSNVAGFDNPTTATVTNAPGGPPVTQSITTPIVIASGVTTTVVVNFAQLGNLRVSSSPAAPTTIYSNGYPMDDWGMWGDMEVGTYNIAFRPVAGLPTPPPLSITVTAGATTHVVGDFTAGTTQVVVP